MLDIKYKVSNVQEHRAAFSAVQSLINNHTDKFGLFVRPFPSSVVVTAGSRVVRIRSKAVAGGIRIKADIYEGGE